MKTTVNERVKVFRTRLTKTQTAFATELEISASLLSRFSAKRPINFSN